MFFGFLNCSCTEKLIVSKIWFHFPSAYHRNKGYSFLVFLFFFKSKFSNFLIFSIYGGNQDNLITNLFIFSLPFSNYLIFSHFRTPCKTCTVSPRAMLKMNRKTSERANPSTNPVKKTRRRKGYATTEDRPSDLRKFGEHPKPDGWELLIKWRGLEWKREKL